MRGGDVLSNLVEYSTQEKRIGTWIDGKPIYRAYVSGNFTGIGLETDFFVDLKDLSSLSIDTCILLQGVIENVGGDKRIIPVNSFESSDYHVCFSYLGTTKKLQHKCTGWNIDSSGWSFEYRILLEYTKN